MTIISAGGAVVGAGGAAGGYQIERSLRFDSSASAHLSRTFGAPGDQQKWTWSCWVKGYFVRASGSFSLFEVTSGDGSIATGIRFNATGNFEYFCQGSGLGTGNLITSAVYRDPSAWYHLVVAVDTTQATAANRIKMYVNGVQVTAFGTATYQNQNTNTLVGTTSYAHIIGKIPYASVYYNGYMTEVHFVNAQQLSPTDFGEYNEDTGVWQPKAYSGSYGTNGFYLNFADNASTATLGDDLSGNSNDWSTSGFSVTAGVDNDSLVDTPTNYGEDTGVGGEVRGNYCTFNAVKPVTNSITFSNGNLQYKPGSSWSTTTYVEGTLGVLGGSTGKYYWEMSADQTGGLWTAGVALQNNTIGGSNIGTTGSVMLYNDAKYVNGTETSSYLTVLAVNEVLGIALDAATGKVWFRDSGGFLGSGDPAAGTNEAGIPTGFSGATLVPVSQANSASTVTANFGQRPFAYTAPSGFQALCTQNLPESEATIPNGGEYFTPYLYTADNTSPKSRTGIGFAPDFLWFKDRDVTFSHALYDIVRGTNKGLQSNTTAAGNTYTLLSTFGSDGFTTTTDGTVGNLLNNSTDDYVVWAWKGGGSGVSNTAGSITSTVSANTDSGFSIVTYTGTGANATVGHGLGVAPKMVIAKSRAAARSWTCWHTAFAGTDYILLNSTNGKATYAPIWNSTVPTSSVFSLGTDTNINSVETCVAYCFAAIPGYSAFGSYTGNGSADGPFVYTGFRPAFVLVKGSSFSSNWIMWDTARDPYNMTVNRLLANGSNADSSGFNYDIDILSSGFKLRAAGEINGNTQTFIYMAFAENPFKIALAR
jgi:hypothetical protein